MDYEFPTLKQLSIDLGDELAEAIKSEYDEIHLDVSNVSPSTYVTAQRLDDEYEYISYARVRFSDHGDRHWDGETDTILIDPEWKREDKNEAIAQAMRLLASRTAKQIEEGL